MIIADEVCNVIGLDKTASSPAPPLQWLPAILKSCYTSCRVNAFGKSTDDKLCHFQALNDFFN